MPHTCVHEGLIYKMDKKLDLVCKYVSDRQAVAKASEQRWKRLKDRAILVSAILTSVGVIVTIYSLLT